MSKETQDDGPTTQERMQKLAEKGAVDPLLLLKMRMDLVTQLLVPDSLVPTLEGAWEGLMERYVDDVEQQLTRQTLLEGVRPSQ